MADFSVAHRGHMPFFSVIVPVYNRAGIIPWALDSIFAQEFRDYELLVVDDGSTDQTRQVLASYGSRLRVLAQENKGPGCARNLGLAQACGRYITFLDSDDVWFPWTLETLSSVLRQYGEPAFVAGADVKFAEATELHGMTATATRACYYPDYFASSSQSIWIGTCAVAIRADVMRQIGGFTNAHVNAEDSDLWLRLGTAPGFVHVQAPPLFGYRRTPQSAATDADRTYRGVLALVEHEKSGRYPGSRDRCLERRAILTRHVRPASLHCLRRHEIAQGLRLYRQSLGWHCRLGRVRYLVGFPMLAAATLVRRLADLGGRSRR